MLKPRPESEIFFKRLKRKVFIFTLIVTFCYTMIVLRLWHLQIVQYTTYIDKAENNRIRQITLDGMRGKIKDRNGVIMVDNRPSFQLALIPEDIENPDAALSILRDKFSVDPVLAMKDIKKAKSFQTVILKRDIVREDVAFVEEHRINLPGIYLEIRPIRNYIHGHLGAHLLGYLGAITEGQLAESKDYIYSRDDFIGQAGVEKSFESVLRGAKGIKRIEVDAAGRELSELNITPPSSGEDLRLTIDYDTQLAAEQSFEGKLGAAVAIDPNTGDILAYVSKPSFDPNMFSYGINNKDWKRLTDDEYHPLQNRPIQGQYPPGSTYKIVTAAAGLEEGVVTPQTRIFCPGSFTLGNRSYRCWKKGGHGTVDVHQALVQSCDVYFYTVGHKIGVDKLSKYSHMFGLGEKTGIDIAGEKAGLIPTTAWKKRARKESWIAGETISCAIGQGYVLTTPIQLTRMVAVIANGGSLVTPHLVYDTHHEAPVPRSARISAKTIEIIKDALHGVTYEPHGTAVSALKNGRYEYAGKTGTAQVIRLGQDRENSTDPRHKDHAWFVAYAPYDNPKIAIAVLAEHGGHGGEAAAPIAGVIMDTYLMKIGVPPTREPAPPQVAKTQPPKPKDEEEEAVVDEHVMQAD